MALNLQDDSKVTYSLSEVDKAGKPIPNPVFDSPPAWVSSNATVIAVIPSADGLSAEVDAKGNPGDTAQVQATVIQGGQTFTATDDITITPSGVGKIVITPGPVSPQ